MRDCKVPIGLWPALREANISIDDVVAIAAIDPGLVDRPAARVPVDRYFALWSAIREVSRDPSIGQKLARSVRLDLTEPLFLAILSAPNVGSALDVLATYKRVITPEVLELRRRAGEIQLAYVWPHEDPPDVLVDIELTFVVEMCRRGTGSADLTPRSISLRRAAVDPASGLRDYFRCPIREGARENAVSFDASLATRPFWTHNPQLAEALASYLQINNASPSPLARVRAAIIRGLNGRRPTLAGVGKELAMSSRSLQRVLKENQTSFRALLDEERNKRALTYLRGAKLTDAEVAFLLGFEDQSSFYRAFRSWNGVSPGEYRARPSA